MKKSKILAPALAILCLSTAASVTGTVAWFAANDVVNADGMTVKSTLPSSLAINDTYNPVGQDTSVTLSQVSQDLSPVSHWGLTNEGVVSEGSGGALYRVVNGEDVDPATGLAYTAEGSDPLEFTSASGGQYYTDFIVYIGSVGQALTLGTGGYLKAEVTFSGNLSATNGAVTMDFYSSLGAVTASMGSYIGCINAAGVDAAANHNAYSPTSTLTNLDILTSGTIPVSTSTTDALKITMRVYYDGALRDSLTTTYVATNTVISSNVNMAVSFSLNRGS